MKVTLYDHADKFLEDNREFIYKNSLVADLVYMNAHCSLSTSEGFYGASVKNNDEVLLSIQVGDFSRVHFSNYKDAKAMTDLLAESYIGNNQIPKSINGDTKTVQSMISSLKERGVTYTLHMELFKRKCTELADIPILDLKVINTQDIDFDFTDYYIQFATECNVPFEIDTAKEKTDKLVESGNFYALVKDTKVVTVAASNRKTVDGRAINMVYTPPEYRGMGYSTCCVKQLTKIILDECDYAFLYADKANLISNHVYEKLGYRVFGEFSQYNLVDA